VHTLETNDSFEGLHSKIETNIKQPPDLVLTSECRPICNKLVKLQIDKSQELDHLHQRICYDTRDVIAYPLSLIFSKSVKTGIISGDWKLVEVTAIYTTSSGRLFQILTTLLVKNTRTITRTSYIRYQYFVSFVFMMWA